MKRKMYIAIAAAAIMTGQTVAYAEDADKPTAELDMGVFSQYIWRGEALSKNSVVVEPSATFGYKGASVNIWGNFDSDSKPYNGAKYNETDLTLSYSKDVGITKLTGGYIYYGLNEQPAVAATAKTPAIAASRDTQELFASVALDVLSSPTLTVYRDISQYPGWYINLAVSHSFEVVDKITFDLGASAGYYYSDSKSLVEAKNPSSEYRALHNGLLSAGFTIPFGDYFSVKPMIAYSFPLSSKADDFIKANSVGGDSSFLYGGVTFSATY
ncbi:MAG: hypothetical protein P4L42_10710 [Desulfocapsaceae bacterium]|nr:hypothetical protein [Desulfocapsaceae bacterium]